MYREQKMHEVENMIKDRNHDLSVDTFATISGIKGRQFGREMFSTVIQFKDLMDFLEVFPEVQRKLNRNKVNKIKRYVLSGLNDPSLMRFFSAITVTARGHMFYNEAEQKVAIDTRQSKLSVNDGQHRFYGIAEAIRHLQTLINKEKDTDKQNELVQQKKDLEEMVIPIVIFNQISEKEEKQLFYDLNNLAQRPSRSATIKLSQTDYISILARELATKNRYLTHYGVEMDKMSIQKTNPNGVLLTTVYAGIKELLKNEIKGGVIEESNFNYYFKKLDGIFEDVFRVLPHDLNEKGKYLLEKGFALRGVFKFYAEARYKLEVDEKEVLAAIEKVDWTNNIDYWKQFGGVESKTGVTFGGFGERGIYQVYNALMHELGWKDPQMSMEELEEVGTGKK